MDTYKLQNVIIKSDLTPTEQHVALVFAVFFSREKQHIQVSQSKIADICGYSERTVRRAVASLIEKNIFVMKHTRRVAILTLGFQMLEKEVGNMKRTWVSYPERTRVSCCKSKKRGIYTLYQTLDTSGSTIAEETEKRDRHRL